MSSLGRRVTFPFALLTLVAVGAVWAFAALAVSASPLSPLQQTDLITRLAIGAAVAALGGVVAVGVIAGRLGGEMATALARLTEAARRVGDGDFSGRISVGGPAEVSRFAAAFNTMTTELHRTIDRLRQESAELEAVLASMADGVIIVDDLGLVRRLNPAAERLLGVSDVAARSRSLSSVARRHELDALSERSPELEGPLVIEIGPERRQVQVVVTSMGGRRGERVIVLQDVTLLRQAEASRRDFVANVSHELRTPLASLRALVETLEDGALDDPPAAREFLGRMHAEVDGLSQMVEELLELARIESGRVRLRMGRADLVALTREVVERFRPQAERSEVQLLVEPEGVAIDATVDRDRFRQILVNLIHNAIKFTPPGGTVRVSVEPRGAAVAVVVADSGVGIAPDDVPRIFERFYKADPARSTPGTGLGLAIVKHLVQIHGGQVWAESPGPGRGATFTVIIPA